MVDFPYILDNYLPYIEQKVTFSVIAGDREDRLRMENKLESLGLVNAIDTLLAIPPLTEEQRRSPSEKLRKIAIKNSHVIICLFPPTQADRFYMEIGAALAYNKRIIVQSYKGLYKSDVYGKEGVIVRQEEEPEFIEYLKSVLLPEKVAPFEDMVSEVVKGLKGNRVDTEAFRQAVRDILYPLSALCRVPGATVTYSDYVIEAEDRKEKGRTDSILSIVYYIVKNKQPLTFRFNYEVVLSLEEGSATIKIDFSDIRPFARNYWRANETP